MCFQLRTPSAQPTLPQRALRDAVPAFSIPPSVGATYLRTKRTPNACVPFKKALLLATNARYHHAQHFKTFARADEPPIALDPVLEGDILAYRDRANPAWSLGAVIEIPKAEQYHVRSLCSRSPPEGGTLECFVDWETDTSQLTIGSDTYEITILDANYEERVVQDRVENPHGEVSEDCWRISIQLLDSLGVSIRRA